MSEVDFYALLLDAMQFQVLTGLLEAIEDDIKTENRLGINEDDRETLKNILFDLRNST